MMLFLHMINKPLGEDAKKLAAAKYSLAFVLTITVPEEQSEE